MLLSIMGGISRNFIGRMGCLLYRKLIRIDLAKLNCLVLLGKNIRKVFRYIYEGDIRYLPNGLDLDAWPLKGRKAKRNFPRKMFFMGQASQGDVKEEAGVLEK